MRPQSRVEITPATLRSMIASVGGVEMSDRELEDVLPIVLAHRELLLGIRHVQLDEHMKTSPRPEDE